jgi:hypothetical protein
LLNLNKMVKTTQNTKKDKTYKSARKKLIITNDTVEQKVEQKEEDINQASLHVTDLKRDLNKFPLRLDELDNFKMDVDIFLNM